MSEEKLIDEINELRELLRVKESQLGALRREKQILQDYGLSNEEISRYSRQIFLPEIGVKGFTIYIVTNLYYLNANS